MLFAIAAKPIFPWPTTLVEHLVSAPDQLVKYFVMVAVLPPTTLVAMDEIGVRNG